MAIFHRFFTWSIPSQVKFSAFFGLLPLSGLCGEGVWMLPPPSLQELAAFPMNLARVYLGMDASGASATPVDLASEHPGLVADDQAGGDKLSPGVQEVYLRMSEPTIVNRLSFFAFQAGGLLDIAYAPVGKSGQIRWQTLQTGLAFVPHQPFSFDFSPAETTALKLTFRSQEAGEISAVLVSGTPKVSQYLLDHPPIGVDLRQQSGSAGGAGAAPEASLVDYDFASLNANAFVKFISNGDPAQALKVVDQDTATSCPVFPNGKDAFVIIDLRIPVNYYLMSLILQAPGGRLEIYALTELPLAPEQNEPNTARTVKWPDDFFDRLSPLLKTELNPQQNRLLVNTGPATARFVILRWLPPTGATEPLYINELSVVGKVPSHIYDGYRFSQVEFAEQTPPPDLLPPPDAPPLIPTSP